MQSGSPSRACGAPGMTPRKVAAFGTLPNRLFVLFRLEPHDKAAAEVEDGALDHGGLVEHEREGLALVEAGLLVVRQLAEGRAHPVEQRLPADVAGPGLEPRAVDPFGLVVVE